MPRSALGGDRSLQNVTTVGQLLDRILESAVDRGILVVLALHSVGSGRPAGLSYSSTSSVQDFLQAWRSGLVRELARAEQHLAEADLASVGRMAHSMKSALRMLGESGLARDASLLEQRCAEQTDAGAWLAWDRLRSGLQAWMAGHGDTASSA